MNVIENRNNNYVLAVIGLLFLSLVLFIVLSGCAPHHYIYKVTFTNGEYEYYDLTYKPKADAKAIEYDGETLLGVERIERLK